MSAPTFTQPARRSLLLPALLALAAIALAVAIALHFFPATTVNIDHLQTSTLPIHTVYKSQSIVLGPDQSQDTLFVASTLRIDNQLRAPIYLDNFILTLTDSTGAQLTAKALQRDDLTNAQLFAPALKPRLLTPLRLDTTIEPGHADTGTLLFSLPIPKPLWDNRRSAILQVDLYHQHSLYLTLPKP